MTFLHTPSKTATLKYDGLFKSIYVLFIALLDSRNKHFLINLRKSHDCNKSILNNCYINNNYTSCNSWHEIFIRTDSDRSEWESESEWKKKVCM